MRVGEGEGTNKGDGTNKASLVIWLPSLHGTCMTLPLKMKMGMAPRHRRRKQSKISKYLGY